LGSKLLVVQADGTYTGDVDIKQGALLAQNNTALGAPGGTTTVESGAALLLANAVPFNNGGILAGLEIWGEHLILNVPGHTRLAATYNLNGSTQLAPLSILPDATVPNLVGASDVIVPTDDLWRGKVTLKTSTALYIPTDTRLAILGTIDDDANS